MPEQTSSCQLLQRQLDWKRISQKIEQDASQLLCCSFVTFAVPFRGQQNDNHQNKLCSHHTTSGMQAVLPLTSDHPEFQAAAKAVTLEKA